MSPLGWMSIITIYSLCEIPKSQDGSKEKNCTAILSILYVRFCAKEIRARKCAYRYLFSMWDSWKEVGEIIKFDKTIYSLCEIRRGIKIPLISGYVTDYLFSMWDSSTAFAILLGPIPEAIYSLCEIHCMDSAMFGFGICQLSILYVRFFRTNPCLSA